MNVAAKLLPSDALSACYDRLMAEGIGQHEPVTLVLMNIDHLKPANLEYGHLAVDEALEQVAALFAREISTKRFAGRIGGDLFAMLQRSHQPQAREFAESTRRQIERASLAHGIRFTASFGVATVTQELPFEALLQIAEACLYLAKARGRNRVVDADEFVAAAEAKDELIFDNDNKIQVLTDRLSHAVRMRSRSLADRYRTEADRDGLTGLFNRRYFDRRLDREFDAARRTSQRLSIILLDLDHFGDVNRTYGHPSGDNALRTFARVLQSNIRPTDWAARYGGEEFCVVLHNSSIADATAVAERVRAALCDSAIEAHDGREIGLTVSSGIAELGPPDVRPGDLIQRASTRLRNAKQGGRNRVCA
jgi:two-component system, cell cycle response regulator